jgi:hypothetical protein
MTRCVVIWEHRFRVAQRVVNYIYTDLQGVFFYLVSFFELFAFQASQVPPSMEMALLNAAAGDPYRTETDSDEETEYAPATAEGGAGGGVAMGSSSMKTHEWLNKQPPLQPRPGPDEVVGKRMRDEVLLSDAEDATPETSTDSTTLVLPSKPKIATSTDSTTLVPPPLAPRVYKIPALPPVNLQNFLYDPAPSPYTLRVPVLHVGLDDAKTRRDRLAAR